MPPTSVTAQAVSLPVLIVPMPAARVSIELSQRRNVARAINANSTTARAIRNEGNLPESELVLDIKIRLPYA
jgi:hypothetical protein